MLLFRNFSTTAESLMGKRRFIFQGCWDLLWVRRFLFWLDGRFWANLAIRCWVIILLNLFQDWILLVDNSQLGLFPLYSCNKVITAFAFCTVALQRINWGWDSSYITKNKRQEQSKQLQRVWKKRPKWIARSTLHQKGIIPPNAMLGRTHNTYHLLR